MPILHVVEMISFNTSFIWDLAWHNIARISTMQQLCALVDMVDFVQQDIGQISTMR